MYHARTGPRFHLFARALHATGQCFCNDTAFLKVRAHPVLAPLCAEGCRDDLPSGGNAFRTLTSRLSSFAMAATAYLTCLCNQLQGLCYKKDFSTARFLTVHFSTNFQQCGASWLPYKKHFPNQAKHHTRHLLHLLPRSGCELCSTFWMPSKCLLKEESLLAVSGLVH